MNSISRLVNKYKNDLHLTELFKGGSISFLYKILGLFLGYIFSIVVARNLGVHSFGIYSLCITLVTVASIFARMGFDTAILRLVAEYNAANRQAQIILLSNFVLKVTLIMSAFISIIVFLYAEEISTDLFKNVNLTNSVKLVSLAITPFSISLIFAGALKGLKKIPKAVFIEYVSKFAFMLFLLVSGLLIFTFNEFSIVFIIVLSTLMMLFTSLYWYWKETRNFSFELKNKIEWQKIVKIAFPLIFASSVYYLKGWIDTISIEVFMTEKEVGIYNAAQKLAGLTMLPLLAINTIAAPKFAENILNKPELKLVLRKTIKMVFLFSVPILAGLIFAAEFLLNIFGNEFLQAKSVLEIVTLGGFINAIFGTFGFYMQMTGHHLAFQNSIIFMIITSIGLNFLLIPQYGLIGAAVSTVIVNLIWNFTIVVFAYSKVKTHIPQ